MTSRPHRTLRTFSLNSPEAYEAVCEPRERPWIANGALPQEPRWPRKPSEVEVRSEKEEGTQQAFDEWQAHVEAGRIGGNQT